ncbi:MAG: succinate dehydrogenase, cytochrome b556 subunit [Alphaproteobacteria bacterium]|jgi:succinate dehydrogenase / fumarate reductase cytochrome b subunit|nr:succinate dehydrogenase, cytochrome b556 subunit [Alphaproteobacteria bacterium]
MPTATQNRPLSPHLQIYRPQITSVLSILHRMTGVALTLGTLLIAYWLIAAASGAEAFAAAQDWIGSFLGVLLLLAWSFSLFYHLCNGVRHLAWDLGLGLEIETVTQTGWVTVAVAGGLTLVAWIVAFAVW